MSIATKTGDRGTTALMYGRRVSKTDVRVEAYGAVDELNAALGTARALAREEYVCESLLAIQKDLVIVMGELATANEDRDRYVAGGFKLVDASMGQRLTEMVNYLEKTKTISFDGWATPGANAVSAAMDMARTICRRAERRVVAAEQIFGEPNPEIRLYLNRLSDLCWLLARYMETPQSEE